VSVNIGHRSSSEHQFFNKHFQSSQDKDPVVLKDGTSAARRLADGVVSQQDYQALKQAYLEEVVGDNQSDSLEITKQFNQFLSDALDGQLDDLSVKGLPDTLNQLAEHDSQANAVQFAMPTQKASDNFIPQVVRLRDNLKESPVGKDYEYLDTCNDLIFKPECGDMSDVPLDTFTLKDGDKIAVNGSIPTDEGGKISLEFMNISGVNQPPPPNPANLKKAFNMAYQKGYISKEAHKQLSSYFTANNLIGFGAVMGAYAIAQRHPGTALVSNYLMALSGGAAFTSEMITLGKELSTFYHLANGAKNDKELDQAAQELGQSVGRLTADGVVTIGVVGTAKWIQKSTSTLLENRQKLMATLEKEVMVVELVHDSNPKFRLSEVNARKILDELIPNGYVPKRVAGAGGAGADLITVNAKGEIFRIENKSTQSFRGFDDLLSDGAQYQADKGLIVIQVPEGTDGNKWMARFWGNRIKHGNILDGSPNNTKKLDIYKNTQIIMIDPKGNIILPRQPIYNPPK